MNSSVHPSAIVDEGAVIGDGCRIWHFSHICADAKIGAGASLGQNVFVARGVRIGDNCKIQNNVSVYEGVTLESEVFCGPSVVFTNVYNPRAFIERKSEYRETIVKQGATLGANATIICGVTIGEFAFIGAGAVVAEDVLPHALVLGVPGRQVGWMSRQGERMPVNLLSAAGGYKCPQSGQRYILEDDTIKVLAD